MAVRRRDKIKALIEGLDLFVVRVNCKRPNAGDVRGRHCAKHGILEKPVAEAPALP